MRRVALVAALLLAGCSGGPAAPGPSAGPPGTASAPASPSPSPSIVAADGTDITACEDADCQVLIGDSAELSPKDPIEVDGMLLTYRAPDGFSIAAGRGTQYVDCDMTGTGHLSMAWGVTVTVEAYTPDGAIVRITPEAEKDDAHTGSGTRGFSLNSN